MVTLQIIHYNAGHIELIRVCSQMSKKDLLEMAGDRDLISGIYNYCDRWCERCAFTSRCFLYATEKSDPDLDDPEARAITNAKFWRKLASIWTQSRPRLRLPSTIAKQKSPRSTNCRCSRATMRKWSNNGLRLSYPT